MRNEEGWEPERLKPILSGVLDLKPWLLQWHNDFDPETGERLGQYFTKFAESQCQELGFSPEEVRAWGPNWWPVLAGEAAGDRHEHHTKCHTECRSHIKRPLRSP
jgi:hypothetical protein